MAKALGLSPLVSRVTIRSRDMDQGRRCDMRVSPARQHRKWEKKMLRTITKTLVGAVFAGGLLVPHAFA